MSLLAKFMAHIINQYQFFMIDLTQRVGSVRGEH